MPADVAPARNCLIAVLAAGVLASVAVVALEGARQATTVPQGTLVAIRTIDAIDSNKATPSSEYRASLDDPIQVDGVPIVPVGTSAWLRIVAVKQAGATRGRDEVTVRLVGLALAGRRTDLESGDAQIQSNSQGANATK